MVRGRATFIYAVILALAFALVTGCGHGVSTGSTSGKRITHSSAKPTSSPQATPPKSNDTRACAGAQGVLGHVTASTSRWSPQRDPFNKDIARSIRVFAGDLDKQGPQADSARVRTSVHVMAQAFTAVSTAMSGKARAKVAKAINQSRIAYRDLKKVCSFD